MSAGTTLMTSARVTPEVSPMRHQGTVTERFWAKVDKSAGPVECWPWLAATDPRGYGRFAHAFAGTPRHAYTASRVAFRLTYGDIPDGLFVLHRCDNPPCCNPSHLWLGDAGANARDMAAKGRMGGTAAIHAATTHCPHGHPYDSTNTWMDHNKRRCRACIRQYGIARRTRRT